MAKTHFKVRYETIYAGLAKEILENRVRDPK